MCARAPGGLWPRPTHIPLLIARNCSMIGEMVQNNPFGRLALHLQRGQHSRCALPSACWPPSTPPATLPARRSPCVDCSRPLCVCAKDTSTPAQLAQPSTSLASRCTMEFMRSDSWDLPFLPVRRNALQFSLRAQSAPSWGLCTQHAPTPLLLRCCLAALQVWHPRKLFCVGRRQRRRAAGEFCAC